MNTDFRHPIRLLHLSGPSAQSLPAIRSEATARARCDPTVADAVPVKKSGRTLFIYSAAQQSTIYEKYWNHMPWIQLEGHWRGEGIWIQLEGDHHCHPWTDRATKEGKTVSSLNIYNISTDQVSKTRSRASKRILLWRGRTVLYLEQGRSEPRFVLINRWSLGKFCSYPESVHKLIYALTVAARYYSGKSFHLIRFEFVRTQIEQMDLPTGRASRQAKEGSISVGSPAEISAVCTKATSHLPRVLSEETRRSLEEKV